ncbi:MAG: hypothetical protein Ct9H300mP25_09400 [Acidobacteriota bacterium]|nr:MAG: hypothetical protein Ct9H300mP25_09400 [Acidobacteriota bacterium]
MTLAEQIQHLYKQANNADPDEAALSSPHFVANSQLATSVQPSPMPRLTRAGG